MPALAPSDFFDLDNTRHRALFDGCDYVWEALGNRLKAYIKDVLKPGVHGEVQPGAWIDESSVFLAEGAVVEPGAYVQGPTIIESGAVIRHGAYVRGNVIIEQDALVGHASETKGSVLLRGAKAPHFNYVGDGLLGAKVNLGAGTKLSNLKVLNETVVLEIEGERFNTGLRKFGGVLGDEAQTGCNSVLNPGVVLGPRTLVYPNLSVPKGIYPADTILKLRQTIEQAQRRPE